VSIIVVGFGVHFVPGGWGHFLNKGRVNTNSGERKSLFAEGSEVRLGGGVHSERSFSGGVILLYNPKSKTSEIKVTGLLIEVERRITLPEYFQEVIAETKNRTLGRGKRGGGDLSHISKVGASLIEW